MLIKLIFTRIYKIFFLKKKIFFKPKKSNILIYDSLRIDIFQEILGNFKYRVLNFRDELNIYVFIRCIFKFKFSKIDYIIEYIDLTNPKILLTYSDNDILFYKIKKLSKKKFLTFAVQNGIRTITGDIFEKLYKSNKKFQLSSDWILTFNKKIGSEYQKYISTNIFSAGNIRNNSNVKQPIKRKIKDSILLISQYSRKQEKGELECISYLFKFLSNYADNNSKSLGVLLRKQDDEDEKLFFTKLTKNKFHFINKNMINNSYYWVERYEITVTIDSTLGYESLSRGNKTAFFYTRSEFTNFQGRKFGWPYNYPKKGLIWTHEKDLNYFKKIIDNLFRYSNEEWYKILKDNQLNKNMLYDENNLKLKLFFKKIFDKHGIK